MHNRIDSHARMLEREAKYIADLRAVVPESEGRADVIDVMRELYRAGWRDCWEEINNAAE